MSMRQFANSLSIIHKSEHRNRTGALLRHLYWQVRKLGFPHPVRLRLSHSQIMDNEPGGVISMVNMLGLYDFNNMNFVQRVLTSGALFVDVGANIGAYTLIASEDPSVTVVSLEPNPTAFGKLRTNVALNNRQNVTLVNMAASAQPGTLRMTDNGADPTNHVIDDQALAHGTITVPVDTLDAICQRAGGLPLLIKLDVEGHEPLVLQGATKCIGHVAACIVENGERDSVTNLLWAQGLRGPFYYRHAQGSLRREPQTLAEDAIFVGKDFERLVPSVQIV